MTPRKGGSQTPPPQLTIDTRRQKVTVEVDATRWLVHDCTIVNATPRPCSSTPHSAATLRVFVGSDGVERHYQFEPGEPKGLTVELVERQLRQAQVVRYPGMPRISGERAAE